MPNRGDNFETNRLLHRSTRITGCLLGGALALLLAVVPVHAGSPPFSDNFVYQGRLEQSGVPAEGVFDFRFELYRGAGSVDSAGGPVFVDALEVAEGVFTAEVPLGFAIDGTDLWLEVAVRRPSDPAYTVLAPRHRLQAAPHAVYAAALDHAIRAGEVDGGEIQLRVDGACPTGQAVRGIDAGGGVVCETAGGSAWNRIGSLINYSDGPVGIGTDSSLGLLEVAGRIRSSGADAGLQAHNPGNPDASARLDWLNDVARLRIGGSGAGAGEGFDIQGIGDQSLLRIQGDGSVGIGTSTPQAPLQVQTGTANDLFYNPALFAETTSAVDFQTAGVHGQSTGSAGRGIVGVATSSSGFTYGVYGRAFSSAGQGMRGEATAASGSTSGVYGESASTSGRGLSGFASAPSGTTYGVRSAVSSPDGYAGFFIGGRNYFQGNVGIGTTSPQAALHVASNALIGTGLEIGTGSSSISIIDDIVAGDTDLRLEAALNLELTAGNLMDLDSAFVRTSNNLNVGFTTGTSNFLLAVNGSAAKPGGGSWSTLSDIRMKKNVVPMADGGGTLDRLMLLRGYEFEYIKEAIESRLGLAGRQIGLIAQEVEQVFPGWVDVDDDGIMHVTERGTTALMIEALRELRAEKDAEIDRLEAQNEELDGRLRELEQLVSELIPFERASGRW